MGFGNFDIVELGGKNIFEQRFDILPLLRRSAIFVRILRRTVLANIIKERMLRFQVNPGLERFLLGRSFYRCRIGKLLELSALNPL